MSIRRPMNEYEGALFSATVTLIGALVELGVKRAALAAKFRESAKIEKDLGHESAEAVLDMLGNIAEKDTYFMSTPRFMVIDGGRADPSN